MRFVNGKAITDRVIARNKIEHIAIRVNLDGTAKTKCGKTVNIPYEAEHRKAKSKCGKCYGVDPETAPATEPQTQREANVPGASEGRR